MPKTADLLDLPLLQQELLGINIEPRQSEDKFKKNKIIYNVKVHYLISYKPSVSSVISARALGSNVGFNYQMIMKLFST